MRSLITPDYVRVTRGPGGIFRHGLCHNNHPAEPCLFSYNSSSISSLSSWQLYWRHRFNSFIRARVPELALLTGFCCSLTVASFFAYEILRSFNIQLHWVIMTLTTNTCCAGIAIALLLRSIRFATLSNHSWRRKFPLFVNTTFFWRISAVIIIIDLAATWTSAVLSKNWLPLRGFQRPFQELQYFQDWPFHIAILGVLSPLAVITAFKMRQISDNFSISHELGTAGTALIIAAFAYFPILITGSIHDDVGVHLKDAKYRPLWIPIIGILAIHMFTSVPNFSHLSLTSCVCSCIPQDHCPIVLCDRQAFQHVSNADQRCSRLR